MDALDGNAIGGLLHEVFGADMTAAAGTCAACGASGPVAEIVIYLHAPGVVGRCRACTSILMVFTRVRGLICADLTGLAELDSH